MFKILILIKYLIEITLLVMAIKAFGVIGAVIVVIYLIVVFALIKTNRRKRVK